MYFLHTFIYMCTFFILGRERVSGGERQKEGEGESEAGSTCSVRSPIGAFIPKLWDHDLSRNQESRSQMLNRLRHLGAPPCVFFTCICFLSIYRHTCFLSSLLQVSERQRFVYRYPEYIEHCLASGLHSINIYGISE